MKMIMRWYINNKYVTLDYIKQIPGICGICSSLDNIPVGEPWPKEAIDNLKQTINKAGLHFAVIESVPVHDNVKLGLPGRDSYIENYCATLNNLASFGVEVVCFNFMPLFDWFRTDLDYLMPDGSRTLAFDAEKVLKIDSCKDVNILPGWAYRYKNESIAELLALYRSLKENTYWDNLHYFLKGIVATLEQTGIKVALHPDDPPWPIFGLPRLICHTSDLNRYLSLVESDQIGLAFCTGSLGVEPHNSLPAMVKEYSSRGKIFFIHIRNVKRTSRQSFIEVAHADPEGDVDVPLIIKMLYDTDYCGYVRPDHGRAIWGESCDPGYGLYDRALGAAYINGVWAGLAQFDVEVC